MTLIACIGTQSNPVFIADALLSSERGRDTAYLPTTGSAYNLVSSKSKYRVHGMTRKLVKIGDFTLVAWAGNVSSAKRILEKLEWMFEHQRPTAANFQAVVMASDRADLENVELIAGIAEGDRICCTRYTPKQPCEDDVKNTWVGGSGRKMANDCLRSMQPHRGSLITALDLVGSLTALEIFTGRTLENNFGSGYEVGYFENGRAVIISNYCYVSWIVDRFSNSSAFNSYPSKIIRASELSHVRCYFTLEFLPPLNGGPVALNSVKHELHAVTSPIDKFDHSELDRQMVTAPDPPLDCSVQIVTFTIRKDGNLICAIPFSSTSGGSDRKIIHFVGNSPNEQIRVNEPLYDREIEPAIQRKIERS